MGRSDRIRYDKEREIFSKAEESREAVSRSESTSSSSSFRESSSLTSSPAMPSFPSSPPLLSPFYPYTSAYHTPSPILIPMPVYPITFLSPLEPNHGFQSSPQILPQSIETSPWKMYMNNKE